MYNIQIIYQLDEYLLLVLVQADADQDVSCIIFTGAVYAFSAGFDINAQVEYEWTAGLPEG